MISGQGRLGAWAWPGLALRDAVPTCIPRPRTHPRRPMPAIQKVKHPPSGASVPSNLAARDKIPDPAGGTGPRPVPWPAGVTNSSETEHNGRIMEGSWNENRMLYCVALLRVRPHWPGMHSKLFDNASRASLRAATCLPGVRVRWEEHQMVGRLSRTVVIGQV